MHPSVHEIARYLRVDSEQVLQRMSELGEPARASSSTVSLSNAVQVIDSFGKSGDLFVKSRNLRTSNRQSLSSQGPRDKRINVNPENDQNILPSEILKADPKAPSSRQFGWHAGPVARPNHPDLNREIRRAERRFPILRDQRSALAALGSQVVHLSAASDPVISGCDVALVRFSSAIETAFGLTREVMVLYTPYPDFQRRTFEAAFRQLKELGTQATPDVIFIVSNDPRLEFKFDDSAPLGLIELLREHLHTRDLFNETTPVSGTKFFGRRTLLQSLREDVISQNVSGIFGLRKAGKTSVLFQLREDLKKDRVITVLIDLETFPSPPEDPIDDILAELHRRIVDEVKSEGLSASKLSHLPKDPSIVQFKNALQTLVKKLDNDGYKLLLMLDEIEYLTPSDQIDVAEGPLPRISQFLASLRAIVQESSNFTFILSGLTSSILESGRLYGRPNPLFSWAKSRYLGPLERTDADNLATSVGARMGIAIDPGALEAIYDASGGHAFLYRNLASAVVESLDTDVDIRRITKAGVLRELNEWSISVQGYVREMINHVGRYYPEESILLELVRDEPDALEEILRDEPEVARHLLDLGLISGPSGKRELNVLLELM